MTIQRIGFGQNSCAANEQACVFGSFEFNKHSILNDHPEKWIVLLVLLMNRHVCLVALSLTNTLFLKIFMITGLNFKLCNLQAYNSAKPSTKSKAFRTIVNISVLKATFHLKSIH